MTALGPGPEFDRIRRIWSRLGDRMAGAGDDCAIVELGGVKVALSIDVSVQDIHFRLGWLAPGEIGWRAAAAALSDLAAVAATPKGILVSLGVTAEWPEEHVVEVMEGAAGAAEAAGAFVWGGDLVKSDRVIVDVAVMGELDGAPVLRSGATPGDGLWVTGALGGPKAALDAWSGGREPEASARERFVKPAPRVAEAKWLREAGAKAMIDISDGIAADTGHLAAASAVRCMLDADRVPRHPAARELMDALVGGEEYELLVALPPSFDDSRARAFQERLGLALTRVGSVREGTGVVVERKGKPIRISGEFRHF